MLFDAGRPLLRMPFARHDFEATFLAVLAVGFRKLSSRGWVNSGTQ
jgi:hypothetical protein